MKTINNLSIVQNGTKWQVVSPSGEVIYEDTLKEMAKMAAAGNVDYLEKIELFKADMNSLAIIEQELSRLEFYDVSDMGYDAKSKLITLYIEWGDWKHSHAYADYVMTTRFNLVAVNEIIDEEDGSDCYSATHIYKIVKTREKKS